MWASLRGESLISSLLSFHHHPCNPLANWSSIMTRSHPISFVKLSNNFQSFLGDPAKQITSTVFLLSQSNNIYWNIYWFNKYFITQVHILLRPFPLSTCFVVDPNFIFLACRPLGLGKSDQFLNYGTFCHSSCKISSDVIKTDVHRVMLALEERDYVIVFDGILEW